MGRRSRREVAVLAPARKRKRKRKVQLMGAAAACTPSLLRVFRCVPVAADTSTSSSIFQGTSGATSNITHGMPFGIGSSYSNCSAAYWTFISRQLFKVHRRAINTVAVVNGATTLYTNPKLLKRYLVEEVYDDQPNAWHLALDETPMHTLADAHGT